MEIAQLSQHGLCLIPVHHKTKRPKQCKWQKRTAQDNNLDEFSGDTSVGVVLGEASGNVVDIDLDSDITRKSAPYFLPPTGWIFGRKSERRSHWVSRMLASIASERSRSRTTSSLHTARASRICSREMPGNS